ncbi:beta-ketoacyl-[acyl-carrier-protein] synthase family protein [Lacunimicrobium album]|jgi:3-oxoacyl-[acyl-carrier-protein] synthase II
MSTSSYHYPRVVISGLGVVSPIGIGKETFWDNLKSGRSGIDFVNSIPSETLPSKFAAEVKNFNPLDYLYNKKFLKVMSRDIQLGVCAASIAMKDSGIKAGMVDPIRMGVEFGAGRISSTPDELVDAVIDFEDVDDDQFTRWGEDRMGKICPLWLLKQLPNMPACHVAIEHNAQGPNNTITSRESSALLALGEAMRTIERGAADVMIVGACSSMTDPLDIARLNLFESLSRRDDDPLRACRPFDRQRDGTVVGEGAAVFVLEEYEHAKRRGAEIYAELLGVGAGCDGFGYETGNAGVGLVRAINAALRRSGVRPDEIGHINAHGKSTQPDDLFEAKAYHSSLGTAAEKIPVLALSSYFGTFDAGTGAVELAGSLMAMRHGELPVTLNYEFPDPGCKLNVVHRQTMPLRNSLAMSVNRTSIGQSAACIVRAL